MISFKKYFVNAFDIYFSFFFKKRFQQSLTAVSKITPDTALIKMRIPLQIVKKVELGVYSCGGRFNSGFFYRPFAFLLSCTYFTPVYPLNLNTFTKK